MSKSDAKLQDIGIQSAFKDQTEAKWAEDTQVNAFDTETFNGTVFMLSYAIDEWSGVVDKGYIGKLTNKKIFEKITHRGCRSAINVWYNLDFDANAILSDILNQEQLNELAITTETQANIDNIHYDIKYVKGKFLLLKDEHGNRYPHYDISQFFYTSLDSAAEEWLGKNKHDEIDASKFGTEACLKHQTPQKECSDCWDRSNASKYIMSNYDTVKEYAVKDAELTQDLAIELIQEGENLGIPFGAPFSTGYLSAEYFRAHMDKKPNFGNVRYQSMFWDSYYGGRFEVFQRGDVGEIVAPDINSAYPAVMADLPDPSTLDWKRYCNEPQEGDTTSDSATFQDIEKADYGVVRAIVTTDPNEPIQPFAHKINGKVHFPVLTDSEVTVIKPIFEFAVKQDLVLDYEIKECWLGNEQSYTEFPFEFIEDLYGERKWYEHEKNAKYKKGKLLKIVLNSGYGKTCQSTENQEIVTVENDEEYYLDDNESIQPKSFISTNQREMLDDDEYIVKSLNCGRRFNPFIASYITGLTRLKLHKSVEKYGLVDDTIMFATDCIMVNKDAYYESDFGELIEVPDESITDEIKFKKQAKQSLGKWDFDYEGDAFIVGSGVYEVEMLSGETKTKTRGFTEKGLDKSLKDLADKYPEGIELRNERPLTISEVLINPDKGNVSEFVKNRKTLEPDFDEKRNWQRENITFKDLLRTKEQSEPVNLIERQEELLQKVQNEQLEDIPFSETETEKAEQ